MHAATWGHGGASYRGQRRCVASVAEARRRQPADGSACLCCVDALVHGCAGGGTMQRMRHRTAWEWIRVECRRLLGMGHIGGLSQICIAGS